MVTVDEVAAWAMALPEVTESTSYGHRTWNVGKHHVAWVRPFSKADVKRFGSEPVPGGPIVALRTEDLGDREAILAAGTRGFFTIEHFSNYPAYLVQLDVVTKKAMRDALLDAWLAVAPAPLAREYLESVWAVPGYEPRSAHTQRVSDPGFIARYRSHHRQAQG